MSPNMFEVTITWNCAGSRMKPQREVVHVEVAGLALGVLRGHELEHAQPELMGVHEHVRLVGHDEAGLVMGPRPREGVGYDALHPPAGC